MKTKSLFFNFKSRFTSIVFCFVLILNKAGSPASLLREPQGPKWIEACRAALENSIMSKVLVANTAMRFWLITCLEETFSFSAVSHHLYGTVKAFLQVFPFCCIYYNTPYS